MGTKKDVFTINQMKDILQIHEQSITNFFSSTLDWMDKRISDLIGENAVLITWRENSYKTKNINNNKNNQLYQS